MKPLTLNQDVSPQEWAKNGTMFWHCWSMSVWYKHTVGWQWMSIEFQSPNGKCLHSPFQVPSFMLHCTEQVVDCWHTSFAWANLSMKHQNTSTKQSEIRNLHLWSFDTKSKLTITSVCNLTSKQRLYETYDYLDRFLPREGGQWKTWFYTTNRRQKLKRLPLGENEAPGVDFIPGPKMRWRQFPIKSMFMGVADRPRPDKGFDRKILLERVSTHQRFSDDVNINSLIKNGQWRNLYVPDSSMPCVDLIELIGVI